MKEKKQSKKLKSKEELLIIMNDHLITQQNIAERLRQKAEAFIEEEDPTKEGKTKRNSYLNAYNVQVDAVSRTSKTLINIYNSSLENEEEQQRKENGIEDELVD